MYNQTNTQIDFTYSVVELFRAVQQQSAYVSRNMSTVAENGNMFDMYCITADETDFFRTALAEAVNSLFTHYITQTDTIADSAFVSRSVGIPPMECCGFSIRRNVLNGVSLYNPNRLLIIDLANAEYLRNYILLRWYEINAVAVMVGVFSAAVEFDIAKIDSNNFELKKRYYGSARAPKPPEVKQKCVALTTLTEYESVPDKRNDTLYACLDEAEGVITKAFVGIYPFLLSQPVKKQYTIEISVNPTDVAKLDTIVADGYVVDSSVSAAKDVYTFTVSDGSSVTIRIKTKEGYKVQQLNINKIAQGAVDIYTFDKVIQNHTGYLWLEEADYENPVNFLVRSDKPDIFYSSTHMVLNAVKADYPNGLTQDVTVSCVKQARERRIAIDPDKLTNERINLAVLNNFNKGSIFKLVIDGAGKLTYDGAGLGVLRFANTDNIVIRDIKFVNFANYVGASTPDEIAAVMLVGLKDSYSRNLYIEQCTFDGISTIDRNTCATYTMSTKYTENITVVSSSFSGNAGLTFRMTNSRLAVFTMNSISGKFRDGAVAHAGFWNVTNGYKLIIEDNEINGTSFRESLISSSNVDHITLSRNSIHGGARVMELSSNTAIKSVLIESNMITNMLNTPIFAWIKEYFSAESDIINLCLRNNTIYVGGTEYVQFVCRVTGADVRKVDFRNNIIIDPDGTRAGLFIFTTLGVLNCGYNLLKLGINPTHVEQTNMALFDVSNPNASSESLTISGANSRSIKYLQDNGYDTSSVLIPTTLPILGIESGVSGDYAVIPIVDAQYPADGDVAVFDLEYKYKSEDNNSRGCYNRKGLTVDEAIDVLSGYTGDDISESQAFTSEFCYDSMADSALLLTHNTMNRRMFVEWRFKGIQHSDCAIGRYVVLHLLPELQSNGEYRADETYDITINKQAQCQTKIIKAN